MGTGRGYAAPTDPRAEIHLNNQLEMSLESSFFDGSSFIEDGGGKAMVNMRDQNLEELLQADDVDPDAFLIKTSGGLHQATQQADANDVALGGAADSSAGATNGTANSGGCLLAHNYCTCGGVGGGSNSGQNEAD